MYEIITHSEAETISFGARLAGLLKAGDVLVLEGDLGAGKTTLTKGLAQGLGVTRTVNSPTFTIIKEYQGRLPLYHMDVYRIDEDEELGFEEYFQGDGVTVVEWGSRIAALLPKERLRISMERLGERERRIRLVPEGGRFVELCKELRK